MIPTITSFELGLDNEQVSILEPDGIDGGLTLLELETIIKLAKKHKAKNIFEIGTFDGRTTINLATIAKHVYTLDLLDSNDAMLPLDSNEKKYIDYNKVRRYNNYPITAKKIFQLFGDSATFNFSLYYKTIDLIFIDGSHAYDYILNDSEIALKLIKNNGIIIWHDYVPEHSDEHICWPGLVRALKELHTKDYRFKNIKHIKDTKFVILKNKKHFWNIF